MVNLCCSFGKLFQKNTEFNDQGYFAGYSVKTQLQRINVYNQETQSKKLNNLCYDFNRGYRYTCSICGMVTDSS